MKLSMTSFAPTAEEAQAKVTQPRFLLKLLAAQQKRENPMLSELLSHLVVKADNKQIDVEMTVRSAPVLRNVADVFGRSLQQLKAAYRATRCLSRCRV